MTSKPKHEELRQRAEEISEEVSAPKESEDALRESQRVLATLMSNLPGMAYRCKNDDNWTMEFVSAGCLALTGYQPDQLMWNRKVSYAQLIHPEDRPDVWKGVQTRLKSKEPFRLTYRITNAAGEERWVWEQGIGIFSDKGDLVALEGFISDITEGKRTAEQLSMLLETLPIVPYTCKADGHFAITYVSTAIEEITGFTPEQFVRDPTFWFDHVHPDDRKWAFRELSDLFESEKSQYEYRFRIADTSFKWFRDIRRLVKFPDGRVSHIVGTWQEITEEKKLRQESEYRLQQVIQADKLASLGEVVAGVAHEINNPNSFIANNIPLLEETWALFEPIVLAYHAAHPNDQPGGFGLEELCGDMNTIIQGIKTGSNRITSVVTNLKDFSRPDESEQPRPVQVNEVIERALTIVGAQMRKFVGNIELNLVDNLPEIQGYYQKLEQVTANLLVNAAYAVPEKQKGKVSITTRYLKRLGAVTMEIEDNGTGMTSEVIEQIFEPFFTTRRDKGGTGLGLSVSYRLIIEHGGIIGVLSKPGIGSRFTVFLPIVRDTALQLRSTILCMDDNRSFLNKLKSDLGEIKTMSFETRIKPKRIMDYLNEHPEVDILLLKIMIPEKDGWALYRRIKSKFPLLTVVLYSSKRMSFTDKTGGVFKSDHLLQTPFARGQLLEIIHSTQRQRL